MTYNFKNKKGNTIQASNYMLAKTIPMFEWEGLPDSLPYRQLERLLQTQGYVFITEHEGKLYAFTGGLGGVQNVYGEPTEIVVANPALNLNKTYNLETDGVLVLSDDMALGLKPLFDKFSFMNVENDVNMVLHGYGTRIQRMISASDDKTRESAELFVKRAIEGDIAIVAENALFEGVKLQGGNNAQSGSVKSLIEYGQYLRAALYNEIGLSSNTNLKRERLVSAEVEQGEDSVFPLVLSMLKCRHSAVEKINQMFGTEIKVDFGSVWKVKHVELIDDIIEDGTETGALPTTPITDPELITPEDKETGDAEGTEELAEENPEGLSDDESFEEIIQEVIETLEEKESSDDEQD